MAIKILSVDDELDLEVLLTQYFRRKIRKGEYEFAFAHNGLEALKLLLEQPDFDIILSDINMPEMDGLTLLTKINEMRNPALKCIMVSAYGDMENIRTAMNRGAFDFATKPIDMEDLERTIEKAVEQIAFIKEAQKEHNQLEAIQYDLNVARDIQQSILPKQFPPFPQYSQFDIYATMNAAKSVGGDFYDFFLIDDNHLGFTIADVSDKGIPAAIFMAISRTVIRATALRQLSPATVLEQSNELLCKESVNNMFVTVFYAILNIYTGEVSFCNGGHNRPVYIRQDGEVSMLPLTGSMALGVMADAVYQEKTIRLNPGDSLFLYTDGISEAMDKHDNPYGNDRLMDVCRSMKKMSSKEMVEIMTNSVCEFVDGALQSDDMTMLAIVYKDNTAV
ncbi:PP2C family protein-serine/threonine phosphatase [Parabacteroides bouchesdurhonensis]|uniref:PP2C family protein-serine/threonine phosphatase n=1 Tax=Parabacteroides bouchesdurhonensis TaxID=1936995 RepID=UPI000E55008D|nr:SpoIIE family protein phosphatase [Parabacteroides bouchesdurhonensis]RHJ93076.1 response regulator [Bacteroides sp. AM07-16]